MSERQVNRKSLIDVLKWFDLVSAFLVFTISIFICINVVLRVTIKKPIFGGYEIIILTTAAIVSFALANCAAQDGHVKVTMLLDKVSAGTKRILSLITDFITLVAFILIDWNLVLYALRKFQMGETTTILNIPTHIVVDIILIGFILVPLFVALNLSKFIKRKCWLSNKVFAVLEFKSSTNYSFIGIRNG